MSTIAIARKGSHVAIGADTLWKDGTTTIASGFLVDDSKIIEVGGTLIAHIGDGSWGHVLESSLGGLTEPPDFSSTRAIFETMRRLHPVLKAEYFMNTDEEEDDPFESSQFLCLAANRHGAFGMFSLRSAVEYSQFYAFGPGYKYALGAMLTAYDEASSAQDVVRVGLDAAAEFDEDTGGPIEIRQIDLRGHE
jgi:ATP-dependent HslUV protease, peptidase subunit HslV